MKVALDTSVLVACSVLGHAHEPRAAVWLDAARQRRKGSPGLAEPLTWEDYRAAIQRCSDRGLRSGSIYDALHLLVAERCGADLLVTFDTRHLLRLAGATSPQIVAPPDPPGLGPVLGS